MKKKYKNVTIFYNRAVVAEDGGVDREWVRITITGTLCKRGIKRMLRRAFPVPIRAEWMRRVMRRGMMEGVVSFGRSKTAFEDHGSEANA